MSPVPVFRAAAPASVALRASVDVQLPVAARASAVVQLPAAARASAAARAAAALGWEAAARPWLPPGAVQAAAIL